LDAAYKKINLTCTSALLVSILFSTEDNTQPDNILVMSSLVRHVCERTSWYIFVLTATVGCLLAKDLGGVFLSGNCDMDEHAEEAEEEATAAAAAAAAF